MKRNRRGQDNMKIPQKLLTLHIFMRGTVTNPLMNHDKFSYPASHNRLTHNRNRGKFKEKLRMRLVYERFCFKEKET
jgi:hypothetical protein